MVPQCENLSVRSISREVDLAWLAGILDGEGSLSVALRLSDKRMYLETKVRVYNTDVRMIQKISRIFVEMNLVFFYNLNKRVKTHYKDQVGICITSHGSSLKLLEAVKPYLSNKLDVAQAMIDIISFVKGLPRAGNTWSNDYADKDEFKQLMEKCASAKVFHIEPSTTSRRAGEVISW